MVLTQNESANSKNTGTYSITKYSENVVTTIGEKINLRLMISNWRMAFAVEENNGEVTTRSFQVFEKYGI